MTSNTLVGDGTWPYTLTIEVSNSGTSYVIDQPDAVATWFGGSSDPDDDGMTACGYPTRGHPDLMGCALAMRVDSLEALRGSPVPPMDFGMRADGTLNYEGAWARVYSYATGKVVTVPVIDRGPGKEASSHGSAHVIDLTRAAYEALGIEDNAHVRVRIFPKGPSQDGVSLGT